MLGATAIGFGSFLAVINVRHRDVLHVVPFLVQLWLFASGVIYAADAIPEEYLNLAPLNPAVGAITGFRWAVVGTLRRRRRCLRSVHDDGSRPSAACGSTGGGWRFADTL